MIMVYVALLALGLCFGSFVNAAVWRLKMQENLKEKAERRTKKGKGANGSRLADELNQLSITKGRSMCTHCRHTLSATDLVPVLSWLWLKGKCRYCSKSIGWQYPLVEALTATLFVASYAWWPNSFDGSNQLAFAVWLVMLVGFMALCVYDFRWMLLPNKIVFPLIGIAVLQVGVQALFLDGGLELVRSTLLAMAVAGGIFYVLYHLSDGKWIGGGDVKLGWLIGLLLQDPKLALLMIFTASLLGTLVSLPLMKAGKLGKKSHLPFGPFLIASTVLCMLWGDAAIHWYTSSLLGL